MHILAILFFAISLLYSIAGFGGGSSYTALLSIFNTNYIILPAISLVCNIIVVTGSTIRFAYNKHISIKKLWPSFVLSVPCAWLGGSIVLSKVFFTGLLGTALLIASFAMFLQTYLQNKNKNNPLVTKDSKYILMPIGALLGFVSGMAGIGGGIFLAPILYLISWGKEKSIAGACSLFIFINSIAGLLGQVKKLDSLNQLTELYSYLPLFVAVFIGGQIGSYFSCKKFDNKHVRIVTAILIFYASCMLLNKFRLMI